MESRGELGFDYHHRLFQCAPIAAPILTFFQPNGRQRRVAGKPFSRCCVDWEAFCIFAG